jgi:hypothetical protein
VEQCPRLQRVHEAQEAGPVRKLGAADAVVNEDETVVDAPTLHDRVGLCVFDLPGDRLLLVGDASLIRTLAGVDGGDHRPSNSSMSPFV